MDSLLKNLRDRAWSGLVDCQTGFHNLIRLLQKALRVALVKPYVHLPRKLIAFVRLQARQCNCKASAFWSCRLSGLQDATVLGHRRGPERVSRTVGSMDPNSQPALALTVAISTEVKEQL